MSSEKYLTLKEAAARLGVDVKQLLLMGADGKLPIAVYADSWLVCDAIEGEDGRVATTSPARVLGSTSWLYMRDGYLRRMLSMQPREALPVGKFSSQPHGAVDIWAQPNRDLPKPAIRRRDLRVRAPDVERLQGAPAQDASEQSGPDRYAVWQRKAVEIAAELMSQRPGHAPTKARVANLVGKRLDVNSATVERQIRNTWAKTRRKPTRVA